MKINAKKKIFPSEFIISELSNNRNFIIDGMEVKKVDDQHLHVSPGKCYIQIKNTILYTEDYEIELKVENTTEDRMSELIDGTYGLYIIWNANADNLVLLYQWPGDHLNEDRSLKIAECSVVDGKILDLNFNEVYKSGVSQPKIPVDVKKYKIETFVLTQDDVDNGFIELSEQPFLDNTPFFVFVNGVYADIGSTKDVFILSKQIRFVMNIKENDKITVCYYYLED